MKYFQRTSCHRNCFSAHLQQLYPVLTSRGRQSDKLLMKESASVATVKLYHSCQRYVFVVVVQSSAFVIFLFAAATASKGAQLNSSLFKNGSRKAKSNTQTPFVRLAVD